MGDFEWTNDLVIRLMEEYKRRPELWDAKHEMYRVQTLKYETWRELANMFECDIADLRKKLNSLFASHRREKAKIRAGGKSSWFLYPYMSFLPSHLDTDSYDGVQTPSTKSRPPIKEVAPPYSSDEDRDQQEEEEGEEEEEEEEAQVFIKQEPVRETHRPRKQITHKPRLTRPVKRRFVKESTQHNTSLETKLADALKLLRKADLTKKKDECDSFGEYIASSLRKHDDRTQSMIKQAINNILFEQEMKKYSTNQQYTVVISGIDENPLILGDHDPTVK